MLLCSAHHTLLHEGGCRVESDGGNGWDFFDHRNRRIEAQPAVFTEHGATSMPSVLNEPLEIAAPMSLWL